MICRRFDCRLYAFTRLSIDQRDKTNAAAREWDIRKAMKTQEDMDLTFSMGMLIRKRSSSLDEAVLRMIVELPATMKIIEELRKQQKRDPEGFQKMVDRRLKGRPTPSFMRVE